MKNLIIISEKTFEKAKIEIRKNKDKQIIFSGNDDDLNRKILEKEKIDVLLINQKERKDKQKQRDSGFNQVLAKIAGKNKIAIGINLDEIINTNGKEKSEILARIQQNIKLCNKKKIQMYFITQNKKNSKEVYDLKALGLTLGMPTLMTKNF